VPVRRLGVPGVIELEIGDASNGLCGGMAFAARDYFEARRRPPPDASPPDEGPLFDYLVDRLFDSFELPRGPVRYLALMDPLLADHETLWSRLGLAPHGRAWLTANDEWPKVREEVDTGHPSPLGLVRVRSLNPFDLKENHQVLVYGYALGATTVTLYLYDPNRPGDDDVRLTVGLGDPPHPTSPTSTPSSRPVLSFFRAGYRPSSPP
jgi:hypothetical protein